MKEVNMTGLRIAKDLKNYIKNHDGEKLRILSVFRESFNLISEDGVLITLLHSGKDIGPMSAIIDGQLKDLQLLKVDDIVEIQSYTLSFPHMNWDVNFEKVAVWNPNVQERTKILNFDKLSKEVLKLKEIILEKGQLGGIVALISVIDFEQVGQLKRIGSESLNEYADFIEDRIIDLLIALYYKDQDTIYNLVPRFVGFGPGLTPSTDDFLLGLMISMIYDTKTQKKDLKLLYVFTSEIVNLVKGKTTKVSESMIYHGSQGKVSEHYRALIQAMFYDVKAPLERLCADVLKTGSTSGTDFLFGVYCYNQLRLKWNREGGIEDDKSRSSKEHVL